MVRGRSRGGRHGRSRADRRLSSRARLALAGEGAAFYQAGGRAGVDPAFLVAISGAESSFGRYIFFAGSQTADYNAFNWFFATTRVGSAFTSWDQAIATVATGLSGPLYYGAGRYSVDTIAPIYCPQGTQAWINNVTAYMLALEPTPTTHGGTAGAGRRERSGEQRGQDRSDGRWCGPRPAASDRPRALVHSRGRSPAHLLHADECRSQSGCLEGGDPAPGGPVGTGTGLRIGAATAPAGRSLVQFQGDGAAAGLGVWRGWVDARSR